MVVFGVGLRHLCMSHYRRPDLCPQTHQINHDMLCTYVLKQIQHFARTIKRGNINSPIKGYTTVGEVTAAIVSETIERIEVGHVSQHSKPGNVIRIQWKLK